MFLSIPIDLGRKIYDFYSQNKITLTTALKEIDKKHQNDKKKSNIKNETMKTTIGIIILSTMSMFFNNSFGQSTLKGKVLIIGGITDYSLTTDFEQSCSKLVLQKLGEGIIKDVVKSVYSKLMETPTVTLSYQISDASIQANPLPYGSLVIKSMYDKGPMAVVPTEFYTFDSKGETVAEFTTYFLPKNPKFNKVPIQLQNETTNNFDYAFVIWPGFWFHYRMETSTVNENKTYMMVLYSLINVKSGEIVFSNTYFTQHGGKELDYNDMIDKIGDNLAKDLLKNTTK